MLLSGFIWFYSHESIHKLQDSSIEGQNICSQNYGVI